MFGITKRRLTSWNASLLGATYESPDGKVDRGESFQTKLAGDGRKQKKSVIDYNIRRVIDTDIMCHVEGR